MPDKPPFDPEDFFEFGEVSLRDAYDSLLSAAHFHGAAQKLWASGDVSAETMAAATCQEERCAKSWQLAARILGCHLARQKFWKWAAEAADREEKGTERETPSVRVLAVGGPAHGELIGLPRDRVWVITIGRKATAVDAFDTEVLVLPDGANVKGFYHRVSDGNAHWTPVLALDDPPPGLWN